jgi:hypothetical protein
MLHLRAHAKIRMDKKSHAMALSEDAKVGRTHELPDTDCILVAVRRLPIRVNLKRRHGERASGRRDRSAQVRVFFLPWRLGVLA